MCFCLSFSLSVSLSSIYFFYDNFSQAKNQKVQRFNRFDLHFIGLIWIFFFHFFSLKKITENRLSNINWNFSLKNKYEHNVFQTFVHRLLIHYVNKLTQNICESNPLNEKRKKKQKFNRKFVCCLIKYWIFWVMKSNWFLIKKKRWRRRSRFLWKDFNPFSITFIALYTYFTFSQYSHRNKRIFYARRSIVAFSFE